MGQIKPGDKVSIVGVFRAFQNSFTQSNSLFDKAIIANNLSVLNSEENQEIITIQEIEATNKLSQRADLITYLRNSLYQSICGNNQVKEALML